MYHFANLIFFPYLYNIKLFTISPKYSRVLTALIRLQADPERLLFFLGDLLKKPLLPNELHIITSVASIWPAPPCRKRGVALQNEDGLNLKVLENDMLRCTLEVAIFHKYHTEGTAAGLHEAVSFSQYSSNV